MDDVLGAILDWTPELQQLYRDLGYEILEPIVSVQPLTWPELWRALRWPAVVVITLSLILSHMLALALGDLLGPLAAMAIMWAIATLMGRWVIDRAYERKRNTLQA